jgi:hypothetical protein
VAKSKRIDWKRARAALDDLRKVAADHPELIGASGAKNRTDWEKVLADDARDVTLEKVSQSFEETRRRIRQIEAKALRRLRSNPLANQIKAALKENERMAATKMVAFRLTTDMVKRLDAHAARLHAMTGLEVTRADVVKLLLGRGLDVVEREAKGGRAQRRVQR